MADFEKVYSVRFDTSTALAALRVLEGKIVSIDVTLSKAFKSTAIKTAVEGVTGKLRAATAATGEAALKMRQKYEAALGGITAKAKPAAAGLRAIDVTAKRVTDAGAALDKIMGKAMKDTASGARKASTAIVATQKAIAATDAVAAKAGARFESAFKRLGLGARGAGKELRLLGSASRMADMSLGGLIARIGMFLGVGFAVRGVVKEFIDFDKAAVGAAARMSEAEKVGSVGYKQMRADVRQMAVDAGASASSTMMAVQSWVKAGLDWKAAKAVMPASLEFSMASDIDISKAGDYLSDALGQFKMRTDDAVQLEKNITRISDVVVKAADISTLGPEQLFESFENVAPLIDATGGSVEQLSADLVVLGNAGIKGSKAGDAMKSIYASLMAPRGPAAKAMKAINVDVRDAQGNFRGLADILSDFDKNTKQMGSAERVGILARIVGREGVTGFLNLMASGSDAIGDITRQLEDAGGTSKRVAKIMRESASKQFEILKSKAMDLGIQILEETNLFGRLSAIVAKIDFKKVSLVITNDVIPAIKEVGKIIAGVLWPAIKDAAKTIKTIMTPVLWLMAKAFGGVSSGGTGLVVVVKNLILAWVAYRTVLMAAMALNTIRYFAGMVKGAAAAAVGQKVLSKGVATTNVELGKTVGLAGSLGMILGSLSIGAAIGTEIYNNLIAPIMKARQEIQLTKEMLAQDKARGYKNMAEGSLEDSAKKTKALIAEEKRHLGTPKGKDYYKNLAPGLTVELFKREKELAEIEYEIKAKKRVIKGGGFEGPQSIFGSYGGPLIGDVIEEDSPDQWSGMSDFSAPKAAEQRRKNIAVAPEDWSFESQDKAAAQRIFEKGSSFVDEWDTPQVTLMQEQIKISEKAAKDASDYQKKMVDASIRGPRGRMAPVVKVEIKNNMPITVKGGDAKEISRVVDLRLRESEKRTSDAVRQASRSAGASEY